MISYGRQSINQDDIEAVEHVIRHENLTQGKQVPAFEQALCDYTGSKHAIAVNSGTSGLHIACLAAGVGQGDIVYTTPNTFVASANCALYCSASVDFVDIDADTRQMSVLMLEDKLRQAEKHNRLPKVVIVVHFAGHACDMEAFYALSERFGFTVIEDNAHGLGASYKGTSNQSAHKLGNPIHSSMTVCSFHPVKSITTCEGGAVLTNDMKLAKKLRLFASHGITKDAEDFLCPTPAIAHFEQQCLGFNYRLSDVHAALGISQLTRIDSFIQKRWRLAQNYHDAFNSLDIKLPILDESSAWHLYVIEVDVERRDNLFTFLRSKNIGVNVHYIPVHWHPYYQQLGFKKGDFMHSEAYFRQAITLPLYPDLTADKQEYVISAVKEGFA